MCPGFNERDSCHVLPPRRIWGPRLPPAQHACSHELVGLAFVAAIHRGELHSTNQPLPRLLKPANQQQAPPRKRDAKSKGPSIFAISAPPSSSTNTSCPQFSTSCFLCKRPLPSNQDIYMYRGDQAFCTKQCRYHQMAVDKIKERMHLRTPAFTPTKCHIDNYKHKERSLACM